MQLTPEEHDLVCRVADFVDEQVRPWAWRFRAQESHVEPFIEEMKQLGLFGLLIPATHGGVDVSAACFVRVTEELARGWVTLAGLIEGHSVVSDLIGTFGTPDQQAAHLPRMADGSLRAAIIPADLSNGSHPHAMGACAACEGDDLVAICSKASIPTVQHAGLIGLLRITDEPVDPPHRGMSVLLVEPADGLTPSGMRVEATEVLGGAPGHGWRHMMRGLDVGRVQAAARAVGVAQAALDEALAHARRPESYGGPIWKNDRVGHRLVDMATLVQAARLLTLDAAARLDEGRRADVEAGMARLFASEAAMRVARDAARLRDGHGDSRDDDTEHFLRSTSPMVVGEATNAVQREVIAAHLVARDARRRTERGTVR